MFSSKSLKLSKTVSSPSQPKLLEQTFNKRKSGLLTHCLGQDAPKAMDTGSKSERREGKCGKVSFQWSLNTTALLSTKQSKTSAATSVLDCKVHPGSHL